MTRTVNGKAEKVVAKNTATPVDQSTHQDGLGPTQNETENIERQQEVINNRKSAYKRGSVGTSSLHTKKQSSSSNLILPRQSEHIESEEADVEQGAETPPAEATNSTEERKSPTKQQAETEVSKLKRKRIHRKYPDGCDQNYIGLYYTEGQVNILKIF